jgi:hypothetical protein
VPEAAAELLAELREQAGVAAHYYAQVNERLVCLPQEIAQGVDAAAIAKAMSESLRQQLAATGLQETASSLNVSAKEMKAVTATVASALRPLTQEYKSISATVSSELTKLTMASRQLQDHNARLIVRERSSVWVWQGLLALVLFLVGGLCGVVLEKRQTRDILSGMVSQIEQIQTPPAPLNPPTKRHSNKVLSH